MKTSIIKKISVIFADLVLVSASIPAVIFCRDLTEQMLQAKASDCLLYRVHGGCMECGGTHFANSLLNGHIFEAFVHNHFYFSLVAIIFVSFILLNMFLLFDSKFAKAALLKLYSLPSLIIALSLTLIFFIARNTPVFIYAGKLIWQILSTYVF